MDIFAIYLIKVFFLGALAFILAFLLNYLLIHLLYKYKFWRKEVRAKAIDKGELPVFQKFHTEGETKIPRGAGVLFWIVPLILIFFFFILAKITDIKWLDILNFLSREQTWLPLFALVVAGLVGFTDDILQIIKKPASGIFKRIKCIGGGLSLKIRLLVITLFGLIGGWWFYARLGEDILLLPGIGEITIGWLIVPLFAIIMLAVYSGGIIDGLDGLAGGAFASIFTALAIISLSLHYFDLAAFCFIVAGTLLAFLWFNIPPAKFYMGETGSMAMTAVIGVIAFFTNSILILPIIGLLLVIWSGSVILQLLSKKFLRKKLLIAAPLHLHLQAKGWSASQITMRFWLIGAVAGIIGVTIRLFG